MFFLSIITTWIVYKNGLKPITTKIVYKKGFIRVQRMSEINELTQSLPESILNITTRIVYKKG